MSDALKVGDTIYRFDHNRRVYDKPGMSGHLVYAGHFVPEVISSETKQSWLIHRGGKIEWKVNKKTMRSAQTNRQFGQQFHSAEGMQDDIWRNDHRHKIERLMPSATAAQLRQIADILGYAP